MSSDDCHRLTVVGSTESQNEDSRIKSGVTLDVRWHSSKNVYRNVLLKHKQSRLANFRTWLRIMPIIDFQFIGLVTNHVIVNDRKRMFDNLSSLYFRHLQNQKKLFFALQRQQTIRSGKFPLQQRLQDLKIFRLFERCWNCCRQQKAVLCSNKTAEIPT